MNVVFEEKQPLPIGWVLLTPAIGICALLAGVLFGEELKTEDYVIGLAVLVPIIVWLKLNRLETRVGNEGVQLDLHDAKSLLIGSQRASELEAAITSSPRYRPARSPD